MTDNAITISNKLEMTYGSRDDVREITDRLMALHPQAKEVGIPGMRAVAQMAIMAGANPLPTAGEIYVWTDFTGRVSTDLGIAYFRRIAAQKDTTMWANGSEPRPMTEQEREQYNIPEGAVAGICKGFLLSEYTQLLDRGVPWQAAMDMLARTSTAVVAKDEMFFADTDYNRKKNRVGKPSPPPSGRTWQWVAEKRAEKGFYRMKALVDTTLTDAIQAQAKQVLATVEHGNGRWITDNDAPDMTLDEFNGVAFDDYNQDVQPDADLENAITIDGEIVEDEPQDTRAETAPDAQKARDPRQVKAKAPESIFRVDDEIMLHGKNDERPGIVTAVNGEMVTVTVDGKSLTVKADKLSLVDMGQS